MIWTKFVNFIARYWHWVLLFVGMIAVSVLTFKSFDSARVFVIGPSEKVTIKVK